jgi:hypothetical protein
MIAGIIVNWVILTGTLTLIRAIAHMKRK